LDKLEYLYISGTPLESLPESIGQLKNLWYLKITEGALKSLPMSIGKLEKLRELYLSNNQIELLPLEIGELKNLQKLLLDRNLLAYLPSEICNLSLLERLNINENKLQRFPDEFSKLCSLNVLDARRNGLTSLPESFGQCEKLEYVNLEENNLTSLPKSMGYSKIKTFNLNKNKFETLPYILWPLETLEDLKLEDNQLSDSEKQLVKRDLNTLRDYFKQRSCMSIFVSHAVVDYEPYHLANLANYLEAKSEVYDVLLCEQDLSGNIDEFMDKNVPISDIVFFLGTNKSVFNSVDCAHELELSRKYKIPILSMKGTDVSWVDITSINLKQDPGIDYNPQEFLKVCEQIYENIKQFHKDHPLYKIKKVEEADVSTTLPTTINWNTYMGLLEEIVESDRLRQFHESKKNEIVTLISQLKSGSINDAYFMMQVSQLYSQWLMMREI